MEENISFCLFLMPVIFYNFNHSLERFRVIRRATPDPWFSTWLGSGGSGGRGGNRKPQLQNRAESLNKANLSGSDDTTLPSGLEIDG